MGRLIALPDDRYFNNVELLLHMNGINGSTTFADSSKNNFAVTVNGNARISTAQSKYGGSSAYFDGAGDYLTIEDNNAFNFNSNFDDSPSIPFTIEAWVYPLSLTSQSMLISKDTYGSNFSWGISLFSNKIGVYTHNINGDWEFEAAATVLTNTWQHVALSMNGTTQRLFLNGVLIGTKNAPITNTSSKITIGCAGWNNPSLFYNGYIDDLRITKGIARYTSNFVPENKMGKLQTAVTLPKRILLQGWALSSFGEDVNGAYTFQDTPLFGSQVTYLPDDQGDGIYGIYFFGTAWVIREIGDFAQEWRVISTNKVLPLNNWGQVSSAGPAGTITILENISGKNNKISIKKQNLL